MSVNPPPSPSAKQRSPLVELLLIAAPVVATMTSYTLMQFVDKLMVSRIGPDPIYVGAQGNGGLAAFVFISVMMGMITVINTYVSQNLGAGKPQNAPAYVATGVWLSVVYWLIVMLPFGLILPYVFEMIRETPVGPGAAAELVNLDRRDQLAVSYGRILIYGSVITMTCRAVAQYFYGMHKPVVILLASLIGNIVNLVFNVILIFGPNAPVATGYSTIDGGFEAAASVARSLGIPAMGVEGAGWATLLGTLVELAIPLGYFLSPKYHRLYNTRSRAVWRVSIKHAKDIFRIGWPGALMFGNEMICWSFFMVYLVGTFGTLHSTAGWIAHQWMTLSFMPTVGISVAMTATVGKCLGMKRPDLAIQRAWLGLMLAVAYMSFCAICFVVFRHDLVRLFVQRDTSPEDMETIVTLGSRFLIATAAFQFFDGIAMSLSGALRGAGDTRWTGLVTLILSWSIIVCGGLAMVRFMPELGSLGPWIAAATYIVILAMCILYRWQSGKWKTISLLGNSSDLSPDATVTQAATDAASMGVSGAAGDPLASPK